MPHCFLGPIQIRKLSFACQFPMIEHEDLIVGAIQSVLVNGRTSPNNGIGMINRSDNVTLRRQILSQVTQEKTRAGIAVRNNDQRELLALHGRGISRGLTGNIHTFRVRGGKTLG